MLDNRWSIPDGCENARGRQVVRYINGKNIARSRRGGGKAGCTIPSRWEGMVDSLDGNIYITWRERERERERERGRRENARSTTCCICTRGNYASPDGNADVRAARSRRRPCIHIQIELYALPDALIRNHSTAWYLENKLVSLPSSPPTRPHLVWVSALRSCRFLPLTNGNSLREVG